MKRVCASLHLNLNLNLKEGVQRDDKSDDATVFAFSFMRPRQASFGNIHIVQVRSKKVSMNF